MTRRALRMTSAIVGAIVVLLAITPFLIEANQLGNLNVPGPEKGQPERRSNPVGAIKDLFKKGR